MRSTKEVSEFELKIQKYTSKVGAASGHQTIQDISSPHVLLQL